MEQAKAATAIQAKYRGRAARAAAAVRGAPQPASGGAPAELKRLEAELDAAMAAEDYERCDSLTDRMEVLSASWTERMDALRNPQVADNILTRTSHYDSFTVR